MLPCCGGLPRVSRKHKATGPEAEVDANLKRAHALRQAVLARALC